MEVKKQALHFNLIRPETKFGICKLGEKALCFYFQVDPEKPEDPFGGVAVMDAKVAAVIASRFAEIATALKQLEEEGLKEVSTVS